MRSQSAMVAMATKDASPITLLVFFSLRSCQEQPTRDSPPPAGIRPPA